MNDQFEYAKAFEKLFDDVRLSGVLSERERIIKLLENQCKCTPPDEYHPSLCTCQEFIAIIKGKTND